MPQGIHMIHQSPCHVPMQQKLKGTAQELQSTSSGHRSTRLPHISPSWTAGLSKQVEAKAVQIRTDFLRGRCSTASWRRKLVLCGSCTKVLFAFRGISYSCHSIVRVLSLLRGAAALIHEHWSAAWRTHLADSHQNWQKTCITYKSCSVRPARSNASRKPQLIT